MNKLFNSNLVLFSIGLMLICALFFSSCSVNSSEGETTHVDDMPSESYESEDDGKSLKLLSFETVNEEKQLKVLEVEQFMLLAETSSEETDGQKQVPDNYEPTSDTHQHVRATIRNVERDSFIDMVLYFSWENTQVVYNEGNGDYQCKSATRFDNESQMWITVIELELDVEFDEEFTAMVEVKEINFLHNGDQKVHAELNSTAVRTIGYCFIYEAVPSMTVEYNGMTFKLIENGAELKKVITTNSTGIVNVPSEIEYKDFTGTKIATVTEIGSGSFNGCKDGVPINTIILPDTIKIIHDNFTGSTDPIIKITLWNSVEVIYPTFLTANNHAEITFYGTEEEWNNLISVYNDYLTEIDHTMNFVTPSDE